MSKIDTSGNVISRLPAKTQKVLGLIQTMLLDTAYADGLYLVGGIVRDVLLGKYSAQDIDIVTELEIEPLLSLLAPISEVEPAYYGRFGTGMIQVLGEKVEFVQARQEVYHPSSRKPEVKPGTLRDDSLRRDFTINALYIRICDGKFADFTTWGLIDLGNEVIKTPVPADFTYREDPLRMLRAVRFACRFGMQIIDAQDVVDNAHRLRIVSYERMREELVKSFRHSAARTLQLLAQLELIDHVPLEPLTWGTDLNQNNKYHIYDVFNHTLEALRHLQTMYPGASDEIIWALALHDVGKPFVIDQTDPECYHFYDHEEVGTRMAFEICERFRFPTKFCQSVANLVSMHMRRPDSTWSDSAYRRLYYDCEKLGVKLSDLFVIMECDSHAGNPEYDNFRCSDALDAMDAVMSKLPETTIVSPLNGDDIMDILNIPPGPKVGAALHLLKECIIEGKLQPDDKVLACRIIRGQEPEISSDIVSLGGLETK